MPVSHKEQAIFLQIIEILPLSNKKNMQHSLYKCCPSISKTGNTPTKQVGVLPDFTNWRATFILGVLPAFYYLQAIFL